MVHPSQPKTIASIYSWATKGESDIATSEFEKWLGEEGRLEYAYESSAVVPFVLQAGQCKIQRRIGAVA